MKKYPIVKVGDRIVQFTYWNTAPKGVRKVVAQTEHFVEVETNGFFSTREWTSKENIEVVLPPSAITSVMK